MIAPPKIKQLYQQMLKDGSALELQNRLAAKDLALWSCDVDVQQSISNRLGWIDCIDPMLAQVTSISTIKQQIYTKGFRHCVLLGMGGSSLAAELFSRLFSDHDNENCLSLQIADNTSPDVVNQLSSSLNLDETLFIVASKSGTTIESDSLFRFFYSRVASMGVANPGQHFIAITDAGTALEKLAEEKDFLHCFVNPGDIGGRFSVLSYFGLVPAALLGVDVAQLLKAAKNELMDCQSTHLVSDATKLGILLGLAAQNGLDKLEIKLATELIHFGAWLEQLIAESTGKSAQGILPLIETLETKTNHPLGDFQITLLDQVSKQSLPVFSGLLNISQLGAQLFKWEWATAIAGAVMQINAFDEPNVSENKAITLNRLESAAGQNSPVMIDDFTKDVVIFDDKSETGLIVKKKIKSVIQSVQPRDYLAILVYGSGQNEVESRLQDFKQYLINQLGIFVTVGVGPRYLHSTGQLHKGGANNGVFLVVTSDFESDLEIPGKAYSFAQLNQAQAIGDIHALRSRQRKLLHVHIKSPGGKNLQLLTDLFNLSVQ